MCLKTRSCISNFSFQPLLISLYGTSLPHISLLCLDLPHLLVLALLGAECLQHSTVPHIWEFLPQSALTRCGHGAGPRPSAASSGRGPGAAAGVVHGIVRTRFADVTANCLPTDLLCDDRSSVRLVERFWNGDQTYFHELRYNRASLCFSVEVL